jgi:hypothetical protein
LRKKRHHYVPKVYLKAFSDKDGKMFVHLKDAPEKIIHQSPDNAAFHKYYYSQPMPDGGRNDDILEDLFSEMESGWPRIVDKLRTRHDLNSETDALVTFMALQRARVPASRDATERMDAALVLATAKLLESEGRLPPKPVGFEDLLDHVTVTIDPHRSLHAMVDVVRAFGTIFGLIGIGALHNLTDVPFLTSDNPVIWFDGSAAEEEIQPYRVQPEGPIVFLFPVSPDLIIYGHSSIRERFAAYGIDHSNLEDPEIVAMMNRQICRFGYEAIFSRDAGRELFIQEFADLSPVLRTERREKDQGRALVFNEMVFGRRSRKVKWRA